MVPTDNPLIGVQNLNLQNYRLMALDYKHTHCTHKNMHVHDSTNTAPGKPEWGRPTFMVVIYGVPCKQFSISLYLRCVDGVLKHFFGDVLENLDEFVDVLIFQLAADWNSYAVKNKERY